METESEPDLKQVIKDFLEELIKATDEKSTPENHYLNIDFLNENVFEIGRQLNLSSDLFTEKEKQTFKEIFPTALISFVDSMYPFVNNFDEDNLTYAKIWLSSLHFIKNEIFNYYKEICGGNVVKTNELEKAFSDIDEKIDDLKNDVKYWSKQSDVKDCLDYIPNLNGVPESHYWWTEENRQFSKNKFK